VIGTSSATPITYRCRAGVRDCKKTNAGSESS
jgi:hypothetical protein